MTARAITYYLEVSAECTRRVVAVDGAVKALCSRLATADLSQRTSRDLAEQCVKVGILLIITFKKLGKKRSFCVLFDSFHCFYFPPDCVHLLSDFVLRHSGHFFFFKGG